MLGGGVKIPDDESSPTSIASRSASGGKAWREESVAATPAPNKDVFSIHFWPKKHPFLLLQILVGFPNLESVYLLLFSCGADRISIRRGVRVRREGLEAGIRGSLASTQYWPKKHPFLLLQNLVRFPYFEISLSSSLFLKADRNSIRRGVRIRREGLEAGIRGSLASTQ